MSIVLIFALNGQAFIQSYTYLKHCIQYTFIFSVYKHVDDLDLYVGGLLEKNDGDSILGPVFKCIIGRQFQLLKKGDRFFYDLSIASNKKVAFTLEELNEERLDCQQICFK